MFNSNGKLVYSSDPYKLIVEVDNNIASYYRSLIPKFLQYQKPLYPAHISVVRNEKEINLLAWNKYYGKNIEFEYDHYIYNDNIYYWLNICCSELEKIREELGLSGTSDYTKSPDGRHLFHCTIANMKHLL
jgi:hypothetical protein